MKLYAGINSPFSRIALIALFKSRSVGAKIHIVNPWKNPQNLMEDNPFSQVPTLVTEAGITMNYTMAICAYLTP